MSSLVLRYLTFGANVFGARGPALVSLGAFLRLLSIAGAHENTAVLAKLPIN